MFIGVSKPCHSKGEKIEEEGVLALWEAGYLQEQGRNRYPKRTRRRTRRETFLLHRSKLLTWECPRQKGLNII